jgi:hypothetical protein
MRKPTFFPAALLFLIIGTALWLTRYKYVVLPAVPPNSANEFDSGTDPTLLRIGRFSGQVWVFNRDSQTWFNQQEFSEIGRDSRAEIEKRCKNAEESGAFRDPNNAKIIGLKGYTFPCD